MTNFEYFDKEKNDKKDDNSMSVDESENENGEENTDNDKIDYNKLTDANKRERKIGYIIEKVYAWRKLYNGFYDEKGEHTRYSLDHAAKQLGISKKSLDDYLLQIRLGRKCGFNFDDNKNEKIGNLRYFVEEQKKKNCNIKKEKKQRKKKKGKKEKVKDKEETIEKLNNKSIDKDLNLIKDKSKNKSNNSLGLKKNRSTSKNLKKK